jgi:hypothetical protein
MSESTDIEQGTMPQWQNLLSPELLLIYIAQHLGELTLDTENKTITMNTTYTYESGWSEGWLNIINDQEQLYLETCVDQKGSPNDLQLFKEFRLLIEELQQKGV